MQGSSPWAAILRPPCLSLSLSCPQELNPATGQPNNTAVVFLNELGNLVDFFFAGQLSGQVRRSGQGAGAVFTDPAKVGCYAGGWCGWVCSGDTGKTSVRPAKVSLAAWDEARRTHPARACALPVCPCP